jgi:hypothetical protein
VAELLGKKTFLNEFIAYESLSKIIDNRRHVRIGLRTISVSTTKYFGLKHEDFYFVLCPKSPNVVFNSLKKMSLDIQTQF